MSHVREALTRDWSEQVKYVTCATGRIEERRGIRASKPETEVSYHPSLPRHLHAPNSRIRRMTVAVVPTWHVAHPFASGGARAS